jgi:hypothetical protein
MTRQKRAALILVMGAVALLWIPATAQVQMTSQVIGSGAAAATDGSLVMAGTIGQTFIGPAASSTHLGAFGFWYTYPTSTTSVRTLPVAGSTPALQIWPNSVSDRTEVHLQLPKSADVTVRLFDALGRERMVLLDGRQQAGTSVLELSVAQLESGNYMVVLMTGPARVAVPLQVVR